MKNKSSVSWKSSKKVRKQRKYRFNSPLHIKHEMLASHLSKELRKKYSKRGSALKERRFSESHEGHFQRQRRKDRFN